MPTSRDPVKAARQRENLRVGNPSHGAYSEAAIRPARERHLAELARAFPNATHAEVTIQAQRLAQLEQLGVYLDARGVIAHKRRGTVYPAAQLAERLAAAYERQAAVLLAREQSHGGTAGDSLAAIVAELSAGDE
jgi:hypothetical protein